MDTVQNLSILKEVSMDPVFEIITDQSSNYLLLFFYPIFPLFLFLFISHYFKKGVHGPHP